MEYYVYYDPTTELTHWGVRGMKWGVRRYQNKDGSLTAAGKKRRAKLEGELEKLGGKKDSDGDSTTRKKTVSEMTDAELREHTARMQVEKNYYDAQKQLAAAMPPKKVSAGQKFANKMLNEVIMPAATNAGKAYLEKMLKEKAGIKEDVKINWDDMIKKQTYEKNEKNKVYEDLKRQNDLDQEKRRKAKFDKEDADAKAAADNAASKDRVKSEYYNDTNQKTTNQYEGTYRNSTGYSRSNSKSSKDTVVDAEWYEVEVTDISPATTDRGRSYVTALLESPKELDD